MSRTVKICFRSTDEQGVAWAIVGGLIGWAYGSAERSQFFSLMAPYVKERQLALTPAIFAAIYCSGLRPDIAEVSDHVKAKQDFLFGNRKWSLYRLTSLDHATIEQIRERLGLTMFGPAPSKNICLVGDQPGIDPQRLEANFHCKVECVNLQALLDER